MTHAFVLIHSKFEPEELMYLTIIPRLPSIQHLYSGDEIQSNAATLLNEMFGSVFICALGFVIQAF